jgi:hypothetical protein
MDSETAERLRRQRDQATAVLGELAAIIPLRETIAATRTGETMIQWFKERLAENERLRAALTESRKVLVVACGDQAPYIKVALGRIDAALAEPQNIGQSGPILDSSKNDGA